MEDESCGQSLPLPHPFPCSQCVPPMDAILPELILHKLPTGCSSPSTALTWLRTMRPTLQALLHKDPHGWQLWPGLEIPTGCASFRPHPLLPLRLLCGFTGRSAPCSAHGLQGDGLLFCGPLLRCRNLLLCAWSSSCPPSALTLVPAGLFSHSSNSSSSCCCMELFSFLISALTRAQPSSLMAQFWQWQRSLLEPDGAGSRDSAGLFCSLSCYQTFPCKPNTIIHSVLLLWSY